MTWMSLAGVFHYWVDQDALGGHVGVGVTQYTNAFLVVREPLWRATVISLDATDTVTWQGDTWAGITDDKVLSDAGSTHGDLGLHDMLEPAWYDEIGTDRRKLLQFSELHTFFGSPEGDDPRIDYNRELAVVTSIETYRADRLLGYVRLGELARIT